MIEPHQEEQGIDIQTDAEAVAEMVELLAHRRSSEEVRRHPRYPTAESLSGIYPRETPIGWLLCGGPVQQAGNGGNPTIPKSVPHGPAEPEGLEPINGLHVVDFSRDGLQIQYECSNPLKYSRRQLYIRVAGTVARVSMQWFNGNEGVTRAGVSFEESIDRSPGLAGILVELSDRLIGYLVQRYLAEHILDYREVAIFSFLCILTNLKLRYVHALAAFTQAHGALDSLIRSNSLDLEAAGRLKSLLLARLGQIHGPGKDGDPEARESLVASVMGPYREYGCSISGQEGRVVFLEKEVMEVLSSSLFFKSTGPARHKGLVTQLRPLHAHFNTLRELVPTILGNEAFTSQFLEYSHAISSVMDSREALIDLMSNLGSRVRHAPRPCPEDVGGPAGNPQMSKSLSTSPLSVRRIYTR